MLPDLLFLQINNFHNRINLPFSTYLVCLGALRFLTLSLKGWKQKGLKRQGMDSAAEVSWRHLCLLPSFLLFLTSFFSSTVFPFYIPLSTVFFFLHAPSQEY